MRSVTRGAAIAAGTLCVGIGVVGIFIPLLPTTPFLLLAALLLARSSRRGHRWLMTNRLFGPTLRRYLEERRMSRLHKAATLVFLWATLGLSAGLAVKGPWARALLAAVGAAVTAHVLTLGTGSAGRRVRRTDAEPRNG